MPVISWLRHAAYGSLRQILLLLPVFLPHVPDWLLKAILGEMSVVLTTGSRISSERLQATGFIFRYPDIISALSAC